MADALTLYQAEWCPFSSAVREVLTELGIDFVARQVEPWPNERAGLRDSTGTDQIPVLEKSPGIVLDREEYLRERRAIGEAYRAVMGRHFPAMSLVEVAGLLESGAKVEVEATAVLP